jgi:hypothetical protein
VFLPVVHFASKILLIFLLLDYFELIKDHPLVMNRNNALGGSFVNYGGYLGCTPNDQNFACFSSVKLTVTIKQISA